MMQENLLKEKTFDLAPAIQARAKKEELGELRKIYSLSKPNTAPFTIGAVCILLSFVLIGMTIPVALGQLPLLYLPTGTASGIIFLMIGLYLMLSRRIYDCHISLWQNGFIYQNKQKIQVFRWNHIECVQRAFPISTHDVVPPFYCIRHQDGYEIKLGKTFLEIAELIDIMLEECARHLAPQTLCIPDPKSTSTFIEFKLDKQGISNMQETFAWEEIQEFVTHSGEVTLRKQIE